MVVESLYYCSYFQNSQVKWVIAYLPVEIKLPVLGDNRVLSDATLEVAIPVVNG